METVSLEPLAQRWRRLPGIERFPVRGAAALTFDDGPDPDGTRAVLDALEACGARATFFALGEQLVRHHGLAREALDRGHELGLHGFSHVDHARLGPGRARDDIARGVWAFEAILGLRPHWFRPPFGRSSEESQAACREFGLETVYWSALGRDWETLPPGAIAAAAAEGLADGAIVLLHDSARFAERPSAAPTAAAVQPLFDAARERGLALRSLGELASGYKELRALTVDSP